MSAKTVTYHDLENIIINIIGILVREIRLKFNVLSRIQTKQGNNWRCRLCLLKWIIHSCLFTLAYLNQIFRSEQKK